MTDETQVPDSRAIGVQWYVQENTRLTHLLETRYGMTLPALPSHMIHLCFAPLMNVLFREIDDLKRRVQVLEEGKPQ